MNTHHPPPTVALLGIGRMGLPMARRLCQAGLAVHAWNRNRSKAEPLAALGATVHDQATDAVRQADIVISMLENGPVVAQVLFTQATAQAMQAGALVVDELTPLRGAVAAKSGVESMALTSQRPPREVIVSAY